MKIASKIDHIGKHHVTMTKKEEFISNRIDAPKSFLNFFSQKE